MNGFFPSIPMLLFSCMLLKLVLKPVIQLIAIHNVRLLILDVFLKVTFPLVCVIDCLLKQLFLIIFLLLLGTLFIRSYFFTYLSKILAPLKRIYII